MAKKKLGQFKTPKFAWSLTRVLLILVVGNFLVIFPLRITIAKLNNPVPQAMLVLGGSSDREIFTARLARSIPKIPIWLSTGESYQKSHRIFQQADVDWQRVNHDTRAVDTVTNFTSLVADIQRNNIRHLYLITSDYHMSRSCAIATIILGSRGIAFTPVIVGKSDIKEKQYRTIRDVIRAIIWLLTRHTGASLNPKFHQNTA